MAGKTKSSEGVLVSAAKAIGSAAGKIAAGTSAAIGKPGHGETPAGDSAPKGGSKPAKPAKAQSAGKLPKKDKSRLPRRQKKAQKKLQSKKNPELP